MSQAKRIPSTEESGKDELMDNMTIFDFIESEHKFAPVIDELSTDISKIFPNHEYTEEYEIWDHVPSIGYRYFTSVSVSKTECDNAINELEKLRKIYAKKDLEISVLWSPCFNTDGTRLHISTLWKDKQRAKNG